MKLFTDAVFYILGLISIAGIVASTFFFLKSNDQEIVINDLNQKQIALQRTIDQKDIELAVASTTIAELKAEIEDIKDDLDDLADDYKDEKNRNEDFENQIRALSGTLGDLDKLSKLDKELLAKYSKVYFLNENYFPPRLKEIDDKYILESKDAQFFHAEAIDFLEYMLKDAARDDIDLKVVSAYRSFDEQSSLKGQYTQVYGEGANTFSADQGYSEHQLGTTIDLTVDSVGGTYNSFAQTEAYKWLLDNAYRYGFILSYPEDNNFYIFEPWHWRFVGTELARDLDRHDETFYEMDQREIDKYLLGIFD